MACPPIFVLDHGRVVEQGRHEELVAAGGLYAHLWPKQTGFLLKEDPGTRFYIIVGGKVEVIRHEAQDAGRVIATLTDGHYFGEVALLENVPQTATLVTRAPTVFLSLDQLYFWALMQQAPEFRALLARLSEPAASLSPDSPAHRRGQTARPG